jgi:hypothetical protein
LLAQENDESIRKFFSLRISARKIPLVSTSLDAVYSKNMDPLSKKNGAATCKMALFMNNRRVKPIPSANEIQNSIIPLYEKGICPLPSDHIPLVAKFKS